MHVVTGKYLKDAAEQYSDASRQIAAWRAIAKDVSWRSIEDVKQVFADVDLTGDYVIFRIRGNRYRLVTTINYSRERDGRIENGHIWIRSFLSEKQYENPANWDKGVLR